MHYDSLSSSLPLPKCSGLTSDLLMNQRSLVYRFCLYCVISLSRFPHMASITLLVFLALLRPSFAFSGHVPRSLSPGSGPPHDTMVSLERWVLRLWLLVCWGLVDVTPSRYACMCVCVFVHGWPTTRAFNIVPVVFGCPGSKLKQFDSLFLCVSAQTIVCKVSRRGILTAADTVTACLSVE